MSAYERRSVKLPLKREPARYTFVRTLQLSQQDDCSSALDAAKGLAADLVQDGYGYQPVTSSVGEDDQSLPMAKPIPGSKSSRHVAAAQDGGGSTSPARSRREVALQRLSRYVREAPSLAVALRYGSRSQLRRHT